MAGKGICALCAGCTIPEFIQHLEAGFKDGMTWKNYGRYGWHIDHIVPCSKFNLTVAENIKTCFHFSNTQPMWAKENHKKGNKQ